MNNPYRKLMVFLVFLSLALSLVAVAISLGSVTDSNAPRKFGAQGGFNFAGGEQRYQIYTRLREYAQDWVTVSPNTWTTIKTLDAMGNTELDVYAALAIIQYTGADAAVNCDGGFCDAVIRRYVPGAYRGGDFCRPDGVCASAGSFDVAEDSFTPGNDAAIMYGAQARIWWNAPNLLLQVNCPAACRAAGGISGQAMQPAVDAGPPIDVGQPDTFDAGSPPTIASCVAGSSSIPCFGSAGGQTPNAAAVPTITGTNLASATSLKLNGVEHIGQSTCSATTCTVNSINAGTQGAFTTISITNPAGTVSYGNGTSTGFTYLPAGYHIYFGDFVTFATSPAVQNWTDVGDQTANTPTQNTVANQPPQVTGGSGVNSHPALFFNGGFNTANMSFSSSLASLTGAHLFAAQKIGSSGASVYEFGGQSQGTFTMFSDGKIYDDFCSTTRVASAVVVTGGFTNNSSFLYEAAAASSGAWTDWINGTQQFTTTGQTVHCAASPWIAQPHSAILTLGALGLWTNQTLGTSDRSVVKGFLCNIYGFTCV